MPEDAAMRSVSRTPSGWVPRAPTRGNWTWLAGGIAGAAVLVAVLLNYPGSGCRPGGGQSLAAAAGPGPLRAGGPPGGPMRVPASAALATPATAPTSATAPPGTSQPRATRATALYYDPGSAVGSCTLGPFPASGRYASLPPRQYGQGTLCGSYLEVRGPHGTVRAEVVDLCPGCAADTINLSRSAFGKIVGAGPAEVTYRPEVNPVLPAPIELRVGTTDAGRVAVQVVNNGNPLRSVAIQPTAAASTPTPAASPSPASTGSGGPAWQELTPNTNDFWVASGPPGPARFTVRIADDQGHQVLIPRILLAPGAHIRTRSWMYQTAASPSPAGPSPASPSPASAPSPTPAGGATPVTGHTGVAASSAGCP
jgi:expansin